LPRISPNISYSPGTDPNPLASFLEALERIGKLAPSFAYPGHRDPFSRVRERTEELIHHHQERLEQMLRMLAASTEPVHAYDLALQYFGKSLTIHTLRFAIAETLAHLIYLEQEDRVKREERLGMIFFAERGNEHEF
jgi:glyoxylase-like metal-dependent hydrolase (beta-lactamase superfamily II)